MQAHNFDNHFKDLFENTSDLIHFLSIDGKIELVNPAWLKTLEYQLNEVVGRSIYDFLHPDFSNAYKACRAEAISNKTTCDVEVVFVTKHGKTIIGEGQIGCSYNKDEALYTRCVFKNITYKRATESKIEESERRLKTFFECAPDAVIVINQYQQILEWNSKAETIFGFTAKEVMGNTLSETIIPHQFREAHKEGMTHFLKTGEGPVLNKTIEITALHKNGNEFYIHLSISNVKIEGEWVFIAFLSDVSERKQTEAALIRKEAELLHAKLLEEKKDEFISIASHELKTPLTTIKAYAQLALNLSSDEVVKQYISKLDVHTGKLTYLINELLDVSKIQSGKLKLSYSEVELNSFLQEVLNSLQHITPDHKIILEIIDTAKVKVDTLRLEQVITNIISNAAKYSPGKNEIIVKSVKQDDLFIISFTDFGIGIPKDKLEIIFSRYYRIDEGSTQFSGLGIGLYISSEIIKQHGGKIWVESKEDKGSTFYFSLPVLN